MVWATNGGIYLGEAGGKPLAYVGDRHITTFGPNGSGKSMRLLYHNLMQLTGWSTLVVDPKGDLFRLTAAHRAKAGSEIILLDPFGVRSHGFNPIAALELNDDFPDDALGLAEAVIRVEGKDPHFSQAAQDFVAALIMYVRLVIAGGSFADVRALLGQDDEGLRQLVLSEEFEYQDKKYPGMVAAGIIHDWEEIGIKASRFGDINPDNRELHSVLSTALTQTRWLDSRPVKRDLAGPIFDFGLLKDRPVTVYLILPARRLGTHSTWLRLMIASVLQSLMKDTRQAKVPVLFMLDEFAQLGHLPIIENNMAMMRGYGIKLWTVLQDLSQLKAIYGERWESFLSNAGVLQSFATQDVTTSDYLSSRTGQTTKQVVSGGTSQQAPNLGRTVSQNVSPVGVPLMMPQDFRNLDDGHTIVFSHKVKGPVQCFAPFPKF